MVVVEVGPGVVTVATIGKKLAAVVETREFTVFYLVTMSVLGGVAAATWGKIYIYISSYYVSSFVLGIPKQYLRSTSDLFLSKRILRESIYLGEQMVLPLSGGICINLYSLGELCRFIGGNGVSGGWWLWYLSECLRLAYLGGKLD